MTQIKPEPSAFEKTAREWLCSGGNGHEDGEDGIRAMTISGESLVEYLGAYGEFVTDAALQAACEAVTDECEFLALAERLRKRIRCLMTEG